MVGSVADPTLPRELRWARLIWLVGTPVSVVLATVSVAVTGGDLVALLAAVGSLARAALTIPAALCLTSRARWAQVTLILFAVLAIGSLYGDIRTHAWIDTVLHLAFVATLGLLFSRASRSFLRTR